MSKEGGFIPIFFIIIAAIIGLSAMVVLKKTERTTIINEASSSATLKISPTPSPLSKKVDNLTPKPSVTATVVPTQIPTTSPNSSTNGSSSSPTPNPTLSSTPTPTPTTGSVTGTVTDSSGNKIANASIRLSCSCSQLRNGGGQDEQADGGGNFSVTSLPASVAITFTPFASYWGSAQTITLTSGQTQNLNLVVGTNTSAKPTVSVTKGPYTQSGGFNTECFDVYATQANYYSLNALYHFGNNPDSTLNLSPSGANSYSGTICGNGNNHSFTVKSYTISTNAYSDPLTVTF